MSFGKVAAGNGVQWLSSAFNIAMKNPGVFLVMALIVAVIGIIPILGSLAMAIIGPALYGGFMYAAQKQERGEPAQVGDLFAAFQIPGKAGPMLMLCLPGIAVMIVLGILGFVLIGGALMAMMSGSGEMGAAGLGGLLLFCLLALGVGLILGAMMFFAIPRVMLDGVEPIAALKESVSAVLANIGAVLIYFVVLFVAAFVLALIPILGMIVLLLSMPLVFSLGSYSAYRDVFGGSAAVAMPTAPMPPAPPAM
jgi:uncharacterized membrane protein